MQRVAIVGLGFVSVLGLSYAQVANALYHGQSGIVLDSTRLEHGFYSGLTGQIVGFKAKDYVNRKQAKTMPEFAIQAYAASLQALSMSGLEPEDIKNPDSGLIFANDSCVKSSLEQYEALKESGYTGGMGSGHVFRCMNSTITLNLNPILGTQGASWTVSAACASGLQAVGQAFDAIRLGRQKRVICGGAQELNWQAMAAFDGLGAFSRHAEPTEASRPFDKNRDGLVPSGGAVALVLENYAVAKQRKVKILGEVLGFGYFSDGYALNVPCLGGLARSMRMA